MQRLLVIATAIVVLGAGGYVLLSHSHAKPGDAQAVQQPYTLPALSQRYENAQYRFALNMPADFKATDLPMPSTGGDTIVLQDNAGNGIQIDISPFDEDTGSGYTLTKERILQDVPDLKISDEQPVDIGDNYHGLAFVGDNQSFGGQSREVWFVFRGNLYQISTYTRLDNLIKAIFATWQFQ